MKLQTRAMNAIVHENGIIETSVREDWDHPDTVEIALENIDALTKAVDGQNRAILSHVPSMHMSKEVMECYEKATIGHVANALLTDSFTTKLMGNLFLRLSKALPNRQMAVPTKLFSKREEAEKWLLQCIRDCERQ